MCVTAADLIMFGLNMKICENCKQSKAELAPKETCMNGKRHAWVEEREVNRAVDSFLRESNAIEGVFGDDALSDAWDAWSHAMTLKRITPDDVCDIHKLLMRRLDFNIAGRIRRVPVFVGSYVCPQPGQLNRMLFQWCEKWDLLKQHDRLAESDFKRSHVEFESIHPFQDGNGRTGRILLNWLRVKSGQEVLIIYANERGDYYQWFKERMI